MSQVRNIANRTLLCRVEERVNGSLYPNEIGRNLVKVPGCSVSASFEDKESDSQLNPTNKQRVIVHLGLL